MLRICLLASLKDNNERTNSVNNMPNNMPNVVLKLLSLSKLTEIMSDVADETILEKSNQVKSCHHLHHDTQVTAKASHRSAPKLA